MALDDGGRGGMRGRQTRPRTGKNEKADGARRKTRMQGNKRKDRRMKIDATTTIGLPRGGGGGRGKVEGGKNQGCRGALVDSCRAGSESEHVVGRGSG